MAPVKKLKPLSEVVGRVKSSAAFADLEDRKKDISSLIGNLITEKQNNRASLGVQKNKIISEVQNIRAAINNHLVKLEKDLLDKLDNTEKKQNENINRFIKKLSEMRRKVEIISVDLENNKQHASNFQAFLGIHEWNKIIEIEEKNWMFLQTNQIMNHCDIHISCSPILMKFEEEVTEFGKIEVKFSSAKKILLKKEKQGQMFVQASNTVDNITLTNIRSFQIPNEASSTMSISGIDMFDDGRIVLADQYLNKRFVIMNQEGEHIKTVPLDDQCYDVAVIDKDTVATTLIYSKKVVIVDVNSAKIQRTIPTKDQCYGIISTGEELVANLYNKTIQFFDLSGNSLSTLSTVDISFYCSVLNDKLYYTTHRRNAVYSTDLNGKVVWKFNCQKSAFPTGITNDSAGNIFVACIDSNKLMVVGQDGKKSRIILTKEDGLQNPRAIYYNRTTNSLLVFNLAGQCFLYTVTN
ncbi:unnamed protein product [Mytilus coruscus]|uniref:TRIM2_3 n=1 Tax=Mytilus coruscus TaxID=42192 RepID=A0A6J8EW92_MYTCO|nr:unnamed protein product [Mytilus coruscus]